MTSARQRYIGDLEKAMYDGSNIWTKEGDKHPYLPRVCERVCRFEMRVKRDDLWTAVLLLCGKPPKREYNKYTSADDGTPLEATDSIERRQKFVRDIVIDAVGKFTKKQRSMVSHRAVVALSHQFVYWCYTQDPRL